jgi:hypothetical protein
MEGGKKEKEDEERESQTKNEERRNQKWNEEIANGNLSLTSPLEQSFVTLLTTQLWRQYPNYAGSDFK